MEGPSGGPPGMGGPGALPGELDTLLTHRSARDRAKTEKCASAARPITWGGCTTLAFVLDPKPRIQSRPPSERLSGAGARSCWS